jgi:hypothetical protein
MIRERSTVHSEFFGRPGELKGEQRWVELKLEYGEPPERMQSKNELFVRSSAARDYVDSTRSGNRQNSTAAREKAGGELPRRRLDANR